MLTVGSRFPQFRLMATVSREPGKEFAELTEQSHPGRWLVLFSWPLDFTFVCPTEIAEFGRRNVDEVLRTLDALQTGELCPCNWKKGDQTLAVA